MRNKKKSLGVRPRATCAVCHQIFLNGTDEEFKQNAQAQSSAQQPGRFT